MSDNKDQNKVKTGNKNTKTSKNKNVKDSKDLSKKVLNIFLAIIVIITVVIGSVIYYQLYKYSSEEIVNTDATNEASTVAEILNTVIDSNSTNTSSSNTTSGNTTISTSDADSRKVLNKEIVVLYDGLVLNVSEMKVVDLQYIDNTSDKKDDYVITYYNYQNFGFTKSSLGILSDQVLDGLVKVDNVGKVAISENYNAIPRDIQVVNSIPAVVLDNNSDFANYDNKKTIICDLDGNGTNEYIVILSSKETGESKIILTESTGFIKATLATMNKSGWESVSTDGYYLSYNNIEILDVDNDGIMEILFELPTTQSIPTQVSLLKYQNGDIQGTTDIACSLGSTNSGN